MESRKRIITLTLCICAILALYFMPISIARAIEYSTYDGPFFKVEYPADWQMSGTTTIFVFTDENKVHYINISIGNNYPTIKILNDYTTFANGAFDEPTMHFLNTLKFKSYSTGQVNNNKTNTETQESSEISASGPNTAEDWQNLGLDLAKQGKYDEATQAYDKAIELDPQSEFAWYGKGITLGMQGKYDESLQAFDKALEIDPQDEYAWNGKSVTLKALGRTTEANAAFAKAKELGYSTGGVTNNEANPKTQENSEISASGQSNALDLVNQASSLIDQNKYDEADQACNKALDLNPEPNVAALAWVDKGTILISKYKYNEAAQAYDKAIDLDPENDVAWEGKGYALEKLGLTTEADAAYAKAKELGYTSPS